MQRDVKSGRQQSRSSGHVGLRPAEAPLCLLLGLANRVALLRGRGPQLLPRATPLARTLLQTQPLAGVTLLLARSLMPTSRPPGMRCMQPTCGRLATASLVLLRSPALTALAVRGQPDCAVRQVQPRDASALHQPRPAPAGRVRVVLRHMRRWIAACKSELRNLSSLWRLHEESARRWLGARQLRTVHPGNLSD